MAISSYGGTVAVDWAGGSTYVDLAEVVDFNPGQLSVTKSPGWHLASAGAFKSTIPGMVSADDATVTLRFTKAQYAAFLTNLRTVAAWRFRANDHVTAASRSTTTFLGFLATVGSPIHGDDDTVGQSVSIALSSLPVFVPAV